MWVPAATAQAYAPTFANAGFEEGDAGQEPPGWSLAGPNAAEYRVEVTQDTPSGGRQCARLFRDPAAAPIGEGEQRYGALQQELDAAPFRGKCVRLQASVRVGAGAPPTRASLWLSVGRPDGHLGHYDSTADGEIAGTEWSGYEALADVAEDANTVTLGSHCAEAGPFSSMTCPFWWWAQVACRRSTPASKKASPAGGSSAG
jgi:hypothetical protein